MNISLYLPIQILMFLILTTSCWEKVKDMAAFKQVVTDYELLPKWLVAVAAPLLAAAELVLAVLLLAPLTTVAAAWGVKALLAIYTVAIAVNIVRGRAHINCGCSGFLEKTELSGGLIVRNGILILLLTVLTQFSSIQKGHLFELFLTVVFSIQAYLIFLVISKVFQNKTKLKTLGAS